MQYAAVFSSIVALGCGGATPSAPPAPPAPRPAAAPASAPPPSNVMVLAGDHAFRNARWLPSGTVLAYSLRELWWIDPANADQARILKLDHDIESVVAAEHDDAVAVITSDHAVTLVRERRASFTLLARSARDPLDVALSPDGGLLSRTTYGASGAPGTELVDTHSGKAVATIPASGPTAFDSTSTNLSIDDALYDRAGKLLHAKEVGRERLFFGRWLGPRYAYVRNRTVTLIDPAGGTPVEHDVSCKSPAVSMAHLFDAGRYVRACGNRFMLVDGSTGRLQRVKLPIAPDSYDHQIGSRPDGYAVLTSGTAGLWIRVDIATGRATPNSDGPSDVIDAMDPSARRDGSYVEVQQGRLALKTEEGPNELLWWGSGGASISASSMSPAVRHSVVGGVLEVVGSPATGEDRAAFVHRFGPAAPPPSPAPRPSECPPPTANEPPAGAVDTRPIDGRPDARCVCLASGCDVRSIPSTAVVLAAARDDLLYGTTTKGSRQTLVRTGPGGTHSKAVDGDCIRGALSEDHRIFVLCRPHAGKRPDGRLQILELASADLTVLGSRDFQSVDTRIDLEVLGSELAVTTTTDNAVTLFYPLGEPGSTSMQASATLSTFGTFSVLQRDGSVQIAGNDADADRAIVCVDADRVRPWSACRRHSRTLDVSH